MKNVLLVLAGILSADLDAVAANDITVISFGRADQAALTQAYYQPFRRSIAVRSASYDGQTTELEQMIKTGKTVWDVESLCALATDRVVGLSVRKTNLRFGSGRAGRILVELRSILRDALEDDLCRRRRGEEQYEHQS